MPGDGPSIPRSILDAIYRQSRAEFPAECCGYIHGRGESARLVQCTNRQDRLHELDPQRYPRTSENAYDIGGRELLDLVASFATDRPVSIIYHSHPGVGAYFSEEDTRAALSAGYPVDYLVVDVQADHVAEAILFRRHGETYVEIERYDGARV